MMDARAIDKGRIVELLDELTEGYEVFAPVMSDDVVLFDKIASGSEARLDFANSKRLPKEAFFPPSEVMFVYAGGQAEAPCSTGDRVLFGIRPCDARSFLLLDKVFNTP
ncbi:unnamed protein product, partial [marine sediment metagenome]